MTEEHRIAVGSHPLGADEVARRTFQTVRKGFDPAAVRSFLESVAGELRAGARREDELQRRVEEAERRATAPPELDEGTLAAALGVETARVLQAAHEAARQVVERAEARAAELESQAQRALDERIAEGEDGARRIREEAREASATVLETARADAERLVESTKVECRSMVAEARQVRARVLRDLTERRRLLRVQVEQLLAGRGSLLSAVDSVRHAVDDLTERLTRAEHEARDAADAADAAAADHEEAAAPEALDREAVEIAAAALAAAEGAEVDAGAAGEAVGSDAVPLEEGGDAADADLVMLHALQEGPPTVATAALPPEEDGDVVFEGVTVLGRVPAAPAPEPEHAGAPEAEGGPAPPADAGAEAGTELAAPPSEASKAAVDELFAKIRASRAEQVARAREILEGEAAAAAAGDGTGEVEAAAPATTGSAGPAGAEAEPAGAPEPAPASAEGPDERTAAAFAARDQLLGPVVARLGRALKRALADDQNDLLDRLRQAASGTALDTLLPREQQEERYATAARAALEAARKAGSSFATSDLGDGAAPPAGDHAEEARSAARRLAEELVIALRLRIEGCLAASAGDRESAGADAVGVAYREWKGSRVTEIAGDHGTRAFAAAQVAVLAAAGADAGRVTWAVDDGGTHCPDCDDNALAGPQPAGEPFPTGQPHPPVHPGCRCLLVSAPS